MFYYAPTVFQAIGYESAEARMWGGVVLGVTFVISGFISMFFIDRIGRRPLPNIGAVFMGLSFLGLAILMSIGFNTYFAQISAVICLVIFMLAFGISSAPIAWIIVTEICPLKGRAFGMAVSTSTNWITNFFIGMSFLSILNAVGPGFTFLLLGVINLLLLIIYYFFTPETKGVPLEQLEKNLMSGVEIRHIGR